MERYTMSMNWKLNIIKVLMVLKLIYRSNAILIKMSTACFGEPDKLILRYMCKNKRPKDSQDISEDE